MVSGCSRIGSGLCGAPCIDDGGCLRKYASKGLNEIIGVSDSASDLCDLDAAHVVTRDCSCWLREPCEGGIGIGTRKLIDGGDMRIWSVVGSLSGLNTGCAGTVTVLSWLDMSHVSADNPDLVLVD